MKKLLPLLLFTISFTIGCKKDNNPNTYTSNAVVSTIAGSGTEGNTNGTGTAASFYWPESVAVDAAGNLYVADSGNDLIRKISPAGIVSTFAGNGTAGDTNGTGTAASFYNPTGIAIDAAGNLYIADQGNNLIREISPAGVVSTLAGSGSRGNTNGTGTVASFNNPNSIAVDAAGNIYVTDQGNNLIREISPSGIVSTLAGSGNAGNNNGTGIAASFYNLTGIAVDAAGNLYVADQGNILIRKISPAGVVSTLAGSGSRGTVNGTGTTASFENPTGITVDASSNIFVTDQGDNLIREINPAGVVSTLAGSGTGGNTNGTGAAASFYNPNGITTDAANNIYVADSGNDLIRKIRIN